MPNLLWPTDQNLLTDDNRRELRETLTPFIDQWLARQDLPDTLWAVIEEAYLPLAANLNESIARSGCRILGVAGGQGAGKSTLSGLLVEILKHGYGRRAVTFSIDDIYLCHAERQQLAKDVHPLLATRGVPGTHDPLLGLSLLQQMKVAGAGDLVYLPVFDKGTDDRLPPDFWRIEEGPFDLIILEGWCVGAMPQTDDELRTPVNELERCEDTDGLWRQFVNDELAGPYMELFAAIDILLMLKVPGMEQVFNWRLKQEEKLRTARAGDATARRVMDAAAIRRFIQHYERLSRHMLREMPGRADIVFELNDRQMIERIVCHGPT